MGFLAALPALLGAGSAVAGGIAGAANTRPPSLDPTQQGSLDSLIPYLQGKGTGTPTIDPMQQALQYGQINQNLTGANNQTTNSLVSRGLGQSGLLGAGLIQNSNQAQSSKNASDLGLQQQSVQLQQQDLQNLIQLLNVGSVPGQSQGGGFLAGMAPLLAYNIQSQQNKTGAQPTQPGQPTQQATSYNMPTQSGGLWD